MILSENAQEPCGHHRGDRVRRPRSQVSDLGARTLPRAARGGHRDGARAEEATGLPGGGARSAQSTGMMAGGGGIALSLADLARHIPVLARQAFELLSVARRRRLHRRHVRRRRAHARDPRSAADRSVIGIDRDRRRDRCAAPRWSSRPRGRLTLVEDRFSNLESVARDARPRGGRRHPARSRRLVDAARPGRARLLVPPRRPARHAHGRRRAERRRSGQRGRASATSPTSSATLGEERFARRRARDRQGARRAADRDHAARSPKSSRRSCARGPARSIRRRARSRRCACS